VALVYVYSSDKYVIHDQVQEEVVILSPSLYWYKYCSIPTKNFIKAKNIAQHMLSQRPENFSEIVLYKNGVDYDAYAYEKSFVKELLKSLHLQNPKVYFANQLQISDETSIDEHKSLFAYNDRVMELPKVETEAAFSITDLSSQLLNSQQHLKTFEKRSNNSSKYYLIGLIFFALYILLSTVNKYQVSNNLDKEIESLETNERSFHEIKALTRKYEKLEKNSQNLKQKISEALKQKELKELVYENDTVKVSK